MRLEVKVHKEKYVHLVGYYEISHENVLSVLKRITNPNNQKDYDWNWWKRNQFDACLIAEHEGFLESSESYWLKALENNMRLFLIQLQYASDRDKALRENIGYDEPLLIYGGVEYNLDGRIFREPIDHPNLSKIIAQECHPAVKDFGHAIFLHVLERLERTDLMEKVNQ